MQIGILYVLTKDDAMERIAFIEVLLCKRFV